MALFGGTAALRDLFLSRGGRSALSTAEGGSLPHAVCEQRLFTPLACEQAEGGSLLHAAAERGRGDVLLAALPVLPQLGVEIDGCDALGRTALHIAVSAADASSIGPLLSAGASPDMSLGGGTALQVPLPYSPRYPNPNSLYPTVPEPTLQVAVEGADLRCVQALPGYCCTAVRCVCGDAFPWERTHRRRATPRV